MTFPATGQPTEQTPAGDRARSLMALVGSGVNAGDGTIAAALVLALGDVLVDSHDTNRLAGDQLYANAVTAPGLLAEMEALYGLAAIASDSIALRRSRLLAKIRAAIAGTPQAIERAVGTISATAIVHEVSSATAIAAGYPRGTFHFGVELGADYDNPRIRDVVERIVDQMKPAHTRAHLGGDIGFLTDDPGSLTDRDLLSV